MGKKRSIPRSCVKYYTMASLNEFTDAGIAEKEEVKLLEKFVSKILELNGMKLLGWAKAKDRYIDVLTYYEIPFICVIETEEGQKVLADVSEDKINIITRELLDSYF